MKKYLFLICSLIFINIISVQAEEDLSRKMSGYILLQVESNGEAWYVNPANLKRYSLGHPQEALNLMKNLSIGITDANLLKFPIGIINNGADSDNDGLPDNLEMAVGTDPQKADSDNDGYSDSEEIKKNYNPNGTGILNVDTNFSKLHAGKIFLRVEKNGEAWYINPADKKRYFLGRPADALALMQKIGLGISNENLNKISLASVSADLKPAPNPTPTYSNCQANYSTNQVMDTIADAIRRKQIERAKSCFTQEMQRAVEYTINFLNDDGRLTLGNIISGSTLAESKENEKVFDNKVYFSMGGYEVSLNFSVKKQPDGRWLLSNL
jgi:hypothetical protein